MTPTESTRLVIRSIADLLAIVPYLVGFHPDDSIVVVAMRGNKITFVARGDLPELDASPQFRAATTAQIVTMVARQDPEVTVIIGYGQADRVTPTINAAIKVLDEAGVPILDALRVTDGRYWSYTCANPTCCASEGTPFDSTTSQAAAAAIFAGQVALPDRATLISQVAPVNGPARISMNKATRRANDRLRALPDDAEIRQAGEAAIREAIAQHRDGGRLTDDDVAWLTVVLAHLPVRDYAWERITDDDWHITLWTDVLCRAEPDLAAAPASLLTFAAWRSGQGALASVALERALQVDPEYSMALLMDDVLRNGVAPSALGEWPLSEQPASVARLRVSDR